MATLVAVRAVPLRPVSQSCETRDREWFSTFYESTCDSVYRFALMLMREPSAAEDIAAEVYLRAWRARDRFEQRGTPIAWILSITRNCALDDLRKRRQQVNLDAIADYEDPAERLAPELSDTDINAIHGAIGRLTREQQQVIFLRFYEELPHESVAARLGRSPNAVRAIQFRALSRLRKLLEASRAS
jgi:RNA polymerase sigma-70 factor (ECF subfamily)